MQGKVNRDEYLNAFTNWVFYQFDRPSDRVLNILIIREVGKIVDCDDEAAYWGGRDNWSMHDLASQRMADKAIVGVTA